MGKERGNTPILDGTRLSIRAKQAAAEGVRSQPQSGVGCASLLDQLVFSLLKKHRLKELKIPSTELITRSPIRILGPANGGN